MLHSAEGFIGRIFAPCEVLRASPGEYAYCRALRWGHLFEIELNQALKTIFIQRWLDFGSVILGAGRLSKSYFKIPVKERFEAGRKFHSADEMYSWRHPSKWSQLSRQLMRSKTTLEIPGPTYLIFEEALRGLGVETVEEAVVRGAEGSERHLRADYADDGLETSEDQPPLYDWAIAQGVSDGTALPQYNGQ